jgi:hypothetical protein
METMLADVIDVIVFKTFITTHMEHNHDEDYFGITHPIGFVPMTFAV